MKKIIVSVLCLCAVLDVSAVTAFDDANYLANEWIITKQLSEKNYRLNDTITRAEMVGIALKLKWTILPENHFCKNYFTDVKYNAENNWVCRAIELAADGGIISRNNTRARPHDAVSFTESMAMISDSQCLIYKKSNFGNFYKINVEEYEERYDNFYTQFRTSLNTSIPTWELELITWFHVFTGYRPQSKSAWLHRTMTRWEVFTLIMESRGGMNNYMLGCKRQECIKKSYDSCTSDCLRVCPSAECIWDDCPATCSEGGYCSDKRACFDYSKNPDFTNWLPGHGKYEPLCKYDCTETNWIKRCNIATS